MVEGPWSSRVVVCHGRAWPRPRLFSYQCDVLCRNSKVEGHGRSLWVSELCPLTKAKPPGPVQHMQVPAVHQACLTQGPSPDMISVAWVSPLAFAHCRSRGHSSPHPLFLRLPPATSVRGIPPKLRTCWSSLGAPCGTEQDKDLRRRTKKKACNSATTQPL